MTSGTGIGLPTRQFGHLGRTRAGQENRQTASGKGSEHLGYGWLNLCDVVSQIIEETRQGGYDAVSPCDDRRRVVGCAQAMTNDSV